MVKVTLTLTPDRPAAPDPAAPAVVAAHAASKGRYGSRKIKASLGRSGVTVSRRRVCRIMRENGLASAYGRKRFKVHPGAVNEADVPNVVARGFGGRAPRTHICSDLTYVRVGASWNYVCLLVDLYNREIVGHSAGPRKDARLVKSAFATLSFPISDVSVNLFFTSFAKQARRSRKGGFTGCANVFSPIPVTA